MSRLTPSHISSVLQHAVNSDLINDSNPWAIFHNLDMFRENLRLVRDSFPSNSLHTLAIKANPLLELLRIALEEKFGLEAASFEETRLAISAGCPPEKIFFDSPAKTKVELMQALKLGVSISADNFEELDRINQLISPECTSKIGLRINPEVGAGRIRQTSVATSNSKFGVLINSNFNKIIAVFEQFPWLTGVHFHVGSQGCDLSLLLAAARRIADLLDAISDRLGEKRIKWINIGGGIPASYQDDTVVPEFHDYAQGLKKITPGLFFNKKLLISEFGRAIQANCGWAASRVEYVKETSDSVLAIVHFGADFLMRTIYAHQDWPHEFLLCTADGALKNAPAIQTTIAGPLCFAGDLPGRCVKLPEPEVNDLAVVRDTGAYTLSMWSRHCNRAIPLIIGYSQEKEKYRFDVLHQREQIEDIINQWNNKSQN
ncbi:MAG: hypothetical protein J5I81_11875 [Nitrococcus mobilis]|nr:hypothetical protein [Nitrococcus mobilis]